MWRRAGREFAPTVLHVHCFGPNGVYATTLSRRSGTPLVITSHGETLADDDGAFEVSALLRVSLRSAIARADGVTAPSDFVLEDLRARFGLEDGVTIPNGVDALGEQPSLPSRLGAGYLLSVGRLGRNKGFDLLIHAFAVAQLPADARLMIVGEGPELESLTDLARSLDVDERVQFIGRLDPAAVAAAMAGATAVVVPSRAEAFGIVALEAWRSGAPLVMTSRGGAAEFIRDGEDALLVDPTRTIALSQTLERLVGDPDLRRRLIAAGRQRWPEFTWSGVAEHYEQLYDAIAASQARPAAGEDA